MPTNEQLIEKFYSAFQHLDYAEMQSCYHPDAVFSDPVFGLLDGNEVRAMWQMLCTRAKDLSLTYGNIQLLDEEYATCDWVASYLFSKTNRRVINKVRGHMRLQDGLITEHSDAFAFYRWARQAFGMVGLLFGWTSFFHRKVQARAKKSLADFIKSA